MDVEQGSSESPPRSAALELEEVPPMAGMDPKERDGIFTALFIREFPTVCSRLRRSGIAPDDVEDVAHEAFLTAYRLLPRCDRLDMLRPWLLRIVHFTVLWFHKQRRRYPVLIDDDDFDLVDASAPADVILGGAQARAVVLRAMEHMDARYRTLIQMHHFDERSLQDVANTLGISLNTAYSRVRRARLELETTMRILERDRAKPGAGAVEWRPRPSSGSEFRSQR